MAEIFFSYSHRDEDWRDRLEVHLATLRRLELITAWHDRRIKAGDELAGKIDQKLESAQIILLLVSADFLNSDYCYDVEMNRAMERHEAGNARVIPVILHHCDWHSAPFGKLLAAPKDGKPISAWPDANEALLNVVQMIRAALPEKLGATRKVAKDIAPKLTTDEARSSNLRVKKVFTDAEKDRFLENGYAYMTRFFEGSLAELSKRNGEIETAFKRIDSNRFSAGIYRDGNSIAKCNVSLGATSSRSITYGANDHVFGSMYNEQLTVESDNHSLYFKPLSMPHFGAESGDRLTFEGAAEYYWSLLMRPLQE